MDNPKRYRVDHDSFIRWRGAVLTESNNDMKFRYIAMVLALHAPALFAAPPVAELTVTGKVKLPSCAVSIGNDGYYDYGRISSTLIQSGSEHTKLEPKTEPMVVTCDAATPLMFSVVDNRKDSSSAPESPYAFGLGNVNGTGKLGHYSVTFGDLYVDGIGKYVWWKMGDHSNGANWLEAGLKPGRGSFGWGHSGLAGRKFEAKLTVYPLIGGTTTMNGSLTEPVDLDGSATLVFAFAL
ncbi:DUF1120 domain-containing protein [Burkholderia sp. 4701]|nr:DUF1120 domain-containing protein [Burkholderia sp. 4701]MXN83046.1 DUF1120 domain-containing protein [Burkholderia sp. 4812]